MSSSLIFCSSVLVYLSSLKEVGLSSKSGVYSVPSGPVFEMRCSSSWLSLEHGIPS